MDQFQKELKNRVVNLLEELWNNYYSSDKKSTKPPTLDRTVHLYQQKHSGEFIAIRKEVKNILATNDFVKIREKDNCGISWNCYCHTQSSHLQECLSSKNRVV